MTDVVDQAQEFEQMRRDEGLRAALADAHRRPEVCVRILACIGCDEPIDAERLDACPAAVRCLDCQEAWERFQRLFPGT